MDEENEKSCPTELKKKKIYLLKWSPSCVYVCVSLCVCVLSKHNIGKKKSFDMLKAKLQECNDIKTQQHTLLEVLENDYESIVKTVQSTVDDMENQKPPSSDAADLCKAFDLQHQQHKVSLGRCQELDQRLRDVCSMFSTSQEELSVFFYARLKTVSEQQVKAFFFVGLSLALPFSPVLHLFL